MTSDESTQATVWQLLYWWWKGVWLWQ